MALFGPELALFGPELALFCPVLPLSGPMAACERACLRVRQAPPSVVSWGPELLAEERGERSNIFRMLTRKNARPHSEDLALLSALVISAPYKLALLFAGLALLLTN